MESDSNGLLGEAFSIIRKGGICIRHNFINASEVTALQNDISQLYRSDQFKPSGLSNRVQGDKNVFGEADRLTCTITPTLLKGEAQYSYIREVVEDKLDVLKQELQNLLNEENAIDDLSMEGLKFDLSEMYYSISPEGSILPRHQDERHEDTKGEKGWMHDTRRSISWLIYLNNDWGAFVDENGIEASDESDESQNCGAGGEFRAYCRKCSSNTQCGSHDGNLQVGWLRSQRSRHLKPSENTAKDDSSLKSIEDYFEPIFLDSWVKMPSTVSGDTDDTCYEEDAGYDKLKWRPMSALYRIRNPINNYDDFDSNRDPMMSMSNCKQSTVVKYPHREYLSEPFGADSPNWPKEIDLEPSEFIEALASQLSDQSIRQRFDGVEDILGQGVEIVDVEPTAGTLVLFDSVVVPHEVLEVTRGERLAVAGWFHETQQPFPDWYGT